MNEARDHHYPLLVAVLQHELEAVPDPEHQPAERRDGCGIRASRLVPGRHSREQSSGGEQPFTSGDG